MSLVQLMVGGSDANRHFLDSLPTVHFNQLVQCLVRSRIWQRVRQFSFACEQWVGPVSAPMHRLRYHILLKVLTVLCDIVGEMARSSIAVKRQVFAMPIAVHCNVGTLDATQGSALVYM